MLTPTHIEFMMGDEGRKLVPDRQTRRTYIQMGMHYFVSNDISNFTW